MSEAIGRDSNDIAFTTILFSICGAVISALALVIAAIAAKDAARSVEMGSGGSRPFLDLSVGAASPRQVTVTNGGNTPAFIEKVHVGQIPSTDHYILGAAPVVETFVCPRIIASGGKGTYLEAAGVPKPTGDDLIVEVLFRDVFNVRRSYWKRFTPNGGIWEQKESGDQQHV